MSTKLTMLGTGNALVTKCYNTCFHVRSGADSLLVDAGGGNGILAQLERAGIPLSDIHHLFLTHTHTDHIMGCIWVIRITMQRLNKGAYEGTLHVYSHQHGIEVLRQICELTLAKDVKKHFDEAVQFHVLEDRESFSIGAMQMQVFDILSTKEKQFGFRLTTVDGSVIACLGDEPYNEATRTMVEGADWLLSEAFCLYADRERFHPYEKHHSTVMDAARLAEQLGARKLLLYHTIDNNLNNRKVLYTQEAREYYHGEVFVPEDLETITIE